MDSYYLDWDRLEFEKADRLVRAVVLQSNRGELRRLRTVTSWKTSVLTDDSQAYLDDNPGSLGVCFGLDEDRVFDIWVSPSYTTANDLFHDTILHELSHGYLGLYKHNQRFRRFFMRVLYHYSALVHPLDISKLMEDSLNRYTLQGQDESYTKYLDRLHHEQNSVEKVAITEAPVVAEKYRWLTRREVR